MLNADEIFKKLSDPLWRINNLYQIISPDISSDPIPFKLRPEQRQFLENEHTRNIIVKGRQLGISTLQVLKLLDECIFSPNIKVGFIDYREVDCGKKLEIALFAFRHGIKHPDLAIREIWKYIHTKIQIVTENKSEIEFSNGSKFMASMTFTGQTLKRLVISEYAVIADEDIGRAVKILQGSMPAVPKSGVITIESTFRGANGPAYEIMTQALAVQGQELSALQWKLFFFKWYNCESYTLPLNGKKLELDANIVKYFDTIKQQHGLEFSDEQKAWYQEMYKTQKRFMRREYPTVISEAVMVTSENQIYPEVTDLRAKNRVVKNLPVEKYYPVYVSADLGSSDCTALWASQLAGKDILLHRAHMGNGYTASDVVKIIRKWELELDTPVDKIILPHDAMRGYGVNFYSEMIKMGVPSQRLLVLPRTLNVWDGINYARDNLDRIYFDKRCDEKNYNKLGQELPSGIECLELYKTTPSNPDRPFHDHAGISDMADSFRYLFEALSNRHISSKDTREMSNTLKRRPTQQAPIRA